MLGSSAHKCGLASRVIIHQIRSQTVGQSSWSMLLCVLEKSTAETTEKSQEIHPPKVRTCGREIAAQRKSSPSWEETKNHVYDDAKLEWTHLIFIQVNVGQRSCLLGFMSLYDCGADLDQNQHCGLDFKNTFLLVRIHRALGQNWSSREEESNAIIISCKGVVYNGIWP